MGYNSAYIRVMANNLVSNGGFQGRIILWRHSNLPQL